MRKNYTHLIVVLDKSGSMAGLAKDTIDVDMSAAPAQPTGQTK